MYVHREMQGAWLRASEQFPVLLLTGARQVGKTTFLKHVCGEDRRYVTLDDPTVRALAKDDPALFLQRFPPPVLIDEIQYAPELLPLIKISVDTEKRPGQFWLTGSQQFRMMKGVSESLAGRVAIVNLLGLSLRERRRLELDVRPFLPTAAALGEREASGRGLSLKGAYEEIWKGSFPARAAGLITDNDLFYSSYVQTYLSRDIRELSRVGDEMAFLRFVRACAARTGQLLNLSNLARDADVSVNTAKSWLSMLEATFQVYLLPPYHSNVTKRLVKAPKLYFIDTGLGAYLTEWSSPETLEAGAMSGAIFETFVFVEILKSWWHRGRRPSLYHFRDKDGKEVDFIFVEDGAVFPVEVKKSASPRRDWTRNFDRLESLGRPVREGGVVCLCSEVIPLTGSINAIPAGMI